MENRNIKIIIQNFLNRYLTIFVIIKSHGSFLRYHLYSWLEKEVQVLHNMCGYSTHINESNIGKCDPVSD